MLNLIIISSDLNYINLFDIMYDINFILLIIGLLLLLSIFLSKFTSKIGVPALAIFLFIGLVFDAGSFITPTVAHYTYVQYISIFALIVIMFSGGLDTNIESMKPIAKMGISLSTIGVFITAISMGLLIHFIFHYDLVLSLLLGSIVSSTDAAAVFSIFNSQKFKLKSNLDKILELESATNDPMAYILVISFIFLILNPTSSITDLVILFVKSLVLGLISGFILGKVFARILASIKLSVEGLYSVLLFTSAILSYAIAESIGGNGFLAVYIAAVLIGNCKIKFKSDQLSFFDGLAWLMQILMFILLGAFTSLEELVTVLVPAILIALILIFIARPLAVLISLAPFDFAKRGKVFLAWAGIKGAVPIVFAFYPLVNGIKGATILFDIVLVISLISVIFQGSTIKFVAKRFNLIEYEDGKT